MRWNKKPIFAVINNHLIDYPTPINLNYFYGFGSLAGIMLVTQILTGIFLAMHYTPHIDLAFNSVEHIMRDVNNGWLIRYIHANGASFFFIAVYVHIFRGLYYGSYITPREYLWCSGVIIFILMMATAFMGYVLPWGQMSFWGATVITNLFSAIPLVGKDIVDWLWGGFAVDNPTLNRFFSLHFTFPFIIVGAVLIHLVLLYKIKAVFLIFKFFIIEIYEKIEYNPKTLIIIDRIVYIYIGFVFLNILSFYLNLFVNFFSDILLLINNDLLLQGNSLTMNSEKKLLNFDFIRNNMENSKEIFGWTEDTKSSNKIKHNFTRNF